MVKHISIGVVIIVALVGVGVVMTQERPEEDINSEMEETSYSSQARVGDALPVPDEEQSELSNNESENNMDEKLTIEVIAEGDGAEIKNGEVAHVHYTGTLQNGEVFDSSIPRKQPIAFTLGVGQVIKGWDQGIVGMKIGEKRKLTIPPDLAYGEAGTPGGPIPPNATLFFDVELVDIQ
ncbi:MAG: FKBP-type peptidyl-prolyl cis-trans isomerase [Candidatus Paceibacterota bacterium]